MYGLMRSNVCPRHAQEAHHRRLHYCGTCKTMGRLYGQSSRVLLNNDAVFNTEKERIINKYTDVDRYCCRMRLSNFSEIVKIVG